MSPRIKTIRKVLNPPIIKGFKPYGPESPEIEKEPVNILFEEYEALRLSDYDMLNHQQSSILMGVSRPTFTRIYASALQKIAKAFVEGRQISIKGGKVYFDSDWYHCNGCGCNFNNPDRNLEITHCPLCGQHQIERFDPAEIVIEPLHQHSGDICICLHCGFEQKHQPGKPCNKQNCPECGRFMKRKTRLKKKN